MQKKIKKPTLSVCLNKAIDARPQDGRLNGWGIRFKTGQDVIVPYHICCSDLRQKNYGIPITEFIFSIKHRKGTGDWFNHPRYNEFLYFMLNHSFISDVFLTKNIRVANRYGVKMNIKYDSNQVLAGFFFLRCAWEYKYYLNSFFWLVDKGIDKNLALCMCQYIEKDGNKITRKYRTGHTPFSDLSKPDLINILKTDSWKVTNKKPVSSGQFHEFRVNALFSPNYFEGSILFDNLQKKTIGKGWDSYSTYLATDVLNKIKEMQEWLK